MFNDIYNDPLYWVEQALKTGSFSNVKTTLEWQNWELEEIYETFYRCYLEVVSDCSIEEYENCKICLELFDEEY